MHQAALLKITFYYLSPLGIALHGACLGMFAWRKNLRQEYPFFFSYVLFQGLSSALLHLLFFRTFIFRIGDTDSYFYIYWVLSALADLFALAVFRELFFAAFKPFVGLRDMARVVFRWAAVSGPGPRETAAVANPSCAPDVHRCSAGASSKATWHAKWRPRR